MVIPSNSTYEARYAVTAKIVKIVGDTAFQRDWAEIVNNAITREDLIHPLAQGIEEYRAKEEKITNIPEIRDDIYHVMYVMQELVRRVESGELSRKDFTTQYGDIYLENTGGAEDISEYIDKIHKELKPLAKYIAGKDGEKEFPDIAFLLISRSMGDSLSLNNEETFLFDAPVDAEMRALRAGGISIDMSQVPLKAKKLWQELEKEKAAATCNNYLAIHLYNYRKMLNDTRRGAKGEQTLPEQWQAYAAEAFVEHMQDHESDSWSKFHRMLSGNWKYNSVDAMKEDEEDLTTRYKDFGREDKWIKVSGEHAHLGWIHFVNAQGNLNGMLFGDVGRIQVKATASQFVNEVNWNNILTALDLIEKLQFDQRPAEDLAREIVYSKKYAGYFVENLINRCREKTGKYLSDNVSASILEIIRSAGFIASPS